MEEIKQAAKAIFGDLPEEKQKEAKEMFKKMDKDEDGEVSVEEFKDYFRSKGDKAKLRSNLFNLVDEDGDGRLQFEEALVLFYIIKSGRPVCDTCNKVIEGLFFTCTSCHSCSEKVEDAYNICIDCYQAKDFKHDHKEFLDNYTLFSLMTKKNSASSSRLRLRKRVKAKFLKPFKALDEILDWTAIALTLYGAVNGLANDEDEADPDNGDDATADNGNDAHPDPKANA